MKLGIISQWFAPEQFPLPNSLSEHSVVAGDEVTVLTGFPSYPFGRIYEGYSQKSGFQEEIADARVYRVRSFLSHDSNALNRIRTFLSFALSSTRNSAILADADVNYVYATPMTASLAAWWCKKRHGVPYVLHVQDLWPESVTSSGMLSKGPVASIAGVIISVLLRPLYAASSHIVAISPSMRSALISRGVDRTKISTILNWEPNYVESNDQALDHYSINRVRFVYAGNLGLMQDAATILEAANLLRDNPNVEIHFYGSGVLEAKLQQLALETHLSNVTFHGRVSKEKMAEIYAASDFQLVTLKDYPLFRMTIPSKFQAAMAHGIPVISTVQGDLKEICQGAGVGLTAEAEDPASLAKVIGLAAALSPADRKTMVESCRALYRRELSPDKGIAAIRAILEAVAIASAMPPQPIAEDRFVPAPEDYRFPGTSRQMVNFIRSTVHSLAQRAGRRQAQAKQNV